MLTDRCPRAIFPTRDSRRAALAGRRLPKPLGMLTRRPTPLRLARAALTAVLVVGAGMAIAPAAGAQEVKPFVALNTPLATDGPKPFARFSESADAMRDSIVALARAQLGKRYVLGGTSPERGFDCSGLVKYVLGLLDVSAPRTARLQAHLGEAVAKDRSELKPRDLLTFGRSRRGASHVAIYVGDGRYIHASVTAGRVIETTLDRTDSPLVRAWRGVRRIFEPTADSATKAGDG